MKVVLDGHCLMNFVLQSGELPHPAKRKICQVSKPGKFGDFTQFFGCGAVG